MNTTQAVEVIKQVKEGNILTPQGFLADGVAAGLRYNKNDIGVIFTESACIKCSRLYKKCGSSSTDCCHSRIVFLKKESCMGL